MIKKNLHLSILKELLRIFNLFRYIYKKLDVSKEFDQKSIRSFLIIMYDNLLLFNMDFNFYKNNEEISLNYY